MAQNKNVSWVTERKDIVWGLDPQKTALIVIDMQNDFVKEGGITEVPSARTIIPQIKKIIKICRELKIPVIYLKCVHRTKYLRRRLYEKFPLLEGKLLVPGSEGVEIYKDLTPSPEDIIIDREHIGAFYNTDLEPILRGISVDTIIFVGIVTNICVESAAREAFDRDFKVVVCHDCCCAISQEIHDASLKNIEYAFGRVMSCSEIINELKNMEEKT